MVKRLRPYMISSTPPPTLLPCPSAHRPTSGPAIVVPISRAALRNSCGCSECSGGDGNYDGDCGSGGYGSSGDDDDRVGHGGGGDGGGGNGDGNGSDSGSGSGGGSRGGGAHDLYRMPALPRDTVTLGDGSGGGDGDGEELASSAESINSTNRFLRCCQERCERTTCGETRVGYCNSPAVGGCHCSSRRMVSLWIQSPDTMVLAPLQELVKPRKRRSTVCFLYGERVSGLLWTFLGILNPSLTYLYASTQRALCLSRCTHGELPGRTPSRS